MSQRSVKSASRWDMADRMGAAARINHCFFPRRSGTFVLVVSLHAVLFYGIVTTLSHVHVSAIPDPLQNLPLVTPHPKELPPLPPPPQWKEKTKVEAQRPEIVISDDTDTTHNVTTEILEHAPPTLAPPSPPRAVARVQGGPGAGFPDPDDFYPALARHMDEQGATTVRVCVDVNGRLTAEPITLQGSGSARLDEGALRLAKAGSGHYRASTEDGRPVNSCYPFRVRFQLKN
jgi:TonB family protein